MSPASTFQGTGASFIGTSVGGGPEISKDCATGLMDSPGKRAEIVDAIQRLRETRPCQVLSRNASRLVHNRFPMDVVARRTAQLYERVLDR